MVKNNQFHAVKAQTHTAPYKIHRYFARRPWNLFEALVEHYSEPNQLILDPFSGGGVTPYEGVKLNRKVIANDINPLSNYIVRNMFHVGKLDNLELAIGEIETYLKEIVSDSFEIKCPSCKQKTQSEWFELVHAVECPSCSSKTMLLEDSKIRSGLYKCSNNHCWKHKTGIVVARLKRINPVYLSIHGRCDHCSQRFDVEIDNLLLDRIHEHEYKLKKLVDKTNSALPLGVIPLEWDRQKEDLLSEKGFIYFQDLFTKKNLYINYLLLNKIKEYRENEDVYQILRFIFSDSLRDTNIMAFTNKSWQNGSPTTWAKHAYWIPSTFCEVNVVKAYMKSYQSIKKNILFNEANGIKAEFANSFKQLTKSKNLLLKTGTLADMKLPNESIDAIITDPPYGSNVQYLELSHFWYIWNKDIYEDSKIDFSKEAIVNRKSTIKNAKTYKTYEDNLYAVFSEGNRVIKKGGHIVMTFNNKDMNSWIALLISVFRAGFHFEQGGITFQDGVPSYKHTAHTKAKGSPYGDFVYEFTKLAATQFNTINATERNELTKKILLRIDLAISQYQKGAERNKVLLDLFNEIVPEIEYLVKSNSRKNGLHDLYTIFRKTHLEPLYA